MPKIINTIIVLLPGFPEVSGKWNFRHCSHMSLLMDPLGRNQCEIMNERDMAPWAIPIMEMSSAGGKGRQGPAMLYELFKLGLSN